MVVDDGKVLHDRLRRENIGVEEILAAARQTQGIARMDQIRYACWSAPAGSA